MYVCGFIETIDRYFLLEQSSRSRHLCGHLVRCREANFFFRLGNTDIRFSYAAVSAAPCLEREVDGNMIGK